MTELALSQPYVIDPDRGIIVERESGEVVSLDDAPDHVVAAIDEYVREQQDYWKRARFVTDDQLTTRLKAQRTRSLRAGPHLVELERKREWDGTLTWEALQGLVTAGLISEADADEACPEKTERKPDGRKLNAILTQVVAENPEAAQALARARSERTYIKLARTAVDAEVVE